MTLISRTLVIQTTVVYYFTYKANEKKTFLAILKSKNTFCLNPL